MTNKSGKGAEPWYVSRRIWGAILSGIAVIGTILFPEHSLQIVSAGSGIAGVLGLTSWVKPKV